MKKVVARVIVYGIVTLLLVGSFIELRHWRAFTSLPDAAIRPLISYVTDAFYEQMNAVQAQDEGVTLPKWRDLQRRAFLIRSLGSKAAGDDFLVRISLHSLDQYPQLDTRTRYVVMTRADDGGDHVWEVGRQISPGAFYLGLTE